MAAEAREAPPRDAWARERQALGRRRLGLLGGTTTWGDALVALRYAAGDAEVVEGPCIGEYEREFASTIGVRQAVSFATGRLGLYAILRALGVGEQDEVLLQVPTHIVVPNAVRYVGARPVFVDCRLDTYGIDLDQAESRITPRTRAIVLQHTFGVPAPLDDALALARRHGLELIEDCVHSLGATFADRQVGSFGRAAFFSTEDTKTISTTMGGMVVTDDADLAARIRHFQARCARPPRSLSARYALKLALYQLLPLPQATDADERRGERPRGYEVRLSNAQAHLGLRQLRRLRANLEHREAVVAAYARRLAELGYEAPSPPAASRPAYVRYPVWVDDRAAAVRRVAPHAVLGTWFTSVLDEAE